MFPQAAVGRLGLINCKAEWLQRLLKKCGNLAGLIGVMHPRQVSLLGLENSGGEAGPFSRRD